MPLPSEHRKTLIAFAAGFLLGVLVLEKHMTDKLAEIYNQIQPIRANDTSYPLIKPLLAYRVPDGRDFSFQSSLEHELQQIVSEETRQKHATDISIYYRDFTTDRWIGINEMAKYSPASMMKVAIAIAYYRQAASNPSILKHTITYTAALDRAIARVPFQTPSTLIVGKNYTVEQLIESLIIFSDNGAKNALLSAVDDQVLAHIYIDLGIQDPTESGGDYTISARAYSLFMRVLYNATYLSRPLSQRALELLIKAQYTDGLVAGVPAGIKVAQKFGEHVSTAPDGSSSQHELHDCGIVYHPSQPYTLCVMTRGSDPGELARIIRRVSRVVYDRLSLTQ